MSKVPSVADLVRRLHQEYLTDPRNKVFVPWTLLVASASEEIGRTVRPPQLSSALRVFQDGTMTSKEEQLDDAAVAVCGTLARLCFGGDPDADVDYDISWDEADGAWSAEVRPS